MVNMAYLILSSISSTITAELMLWAIGSMITVEIIFSFYFDEDVEF